AIVSWGNNQSGQRNIPSSANGGSILEIRGNAYHVFATTASVARPVINYQNSIYTIVDGTSWTEAEANAVKLGGHLVAINSNGENDFLWREFSNATKYQIRPNAPESPGIFSHWIGLTDLEQEGNWKWSNGDPMAFVNPPFTIQEGTYRTDENWVRVTWNVPSSWTGGIETKGFWQDHNVDAYQNGYETPTGIAEMPFVRFRDSAYVVVQGPTWEDAEANAIKLGGHLVTIDNAQENAFLKSAVLDKIPRNEEGMYIGYRIILGSNTWSWIGESGSGYVNWATGAPNGAGVEKYSVIGVTGVWDDWTNRQGPITRGIAEIKLPEENMVTVLGGTLPSSSELAGQSVGTFQIGKYEVTWGEWQEVRDWAVENGYMDLAGVGDGASNSHPVRLVNWFEAVKWCNAKSEKEGLRPVYFQNGQVYREGEGANDPYFDPNGVEEYKIDIQPSTNGYRLPYDSEWEWAALGGVSSEGFTYSGSNNLGSVAWFEANSIGALSEFYQGRGTYPVGLKQANELGIHDMSGNAVEWVWDSFGDWKRVRGGHFASSENECSVFNRAYDAAAYRDSSAYKLGGFRLARNVAAPADTTAPVIALNGANPQEVYKGSTYTDPGAVVTDNVDASRTITGNVSVDATKVGNYTLTYATKDAAGNSAASVLRTVNVVLDPNGDEDGDGLTNAQEVTLGTNPNLSDSDGDGINDYREIKDVTDPKNASSFDPLSNGLVAYYSFNGTYQSGAGVGDSAIP
ncbi:MAG: DUF5011 domain-containing protein, partial [Spartobacteria bacterium]|nr:DUF5011 domain-containing protein [Spartobacteria bacterium]